MRREANDDGSNGGMSSIRLKYKGGRFGKFKANDGVVMKTTKTEISKSGGSAIEEEKIIIKKESKLNRGIAASPNESSSKITTKTIIQGGDGEKSRSQVTVTKTEITESQRGGNSKDNSRLKEAKGSKITSKTTEITTSTTMNAGGLRNGSQGRKVREEVTTKTMTTTSRQEGNIRGKNSGKTETVKTVTNKVSESGSSQRKVRGGKEEITTTTTTTTTNQSSGNLPRSSQKEQTTAATTKTTTTTTNQRTSSRGPSQGQKAKVVKEVITETSVNRRNSGTQGTKTTTKTVTTAQGQGRSSKSKEASYSSLTTANPTKINTRGNNGRVGAKISQETTVVKSAQKSLINQKSTPALRISDQVTSKTSLKETTKRPLSSTTDIRSRGDNIVRIYIDETGKIPKKTYILNVRKLDRIQQDKRQRLAYSSKLDEKEAVQTNFNHNIIVIKNITNEVKPSNLPNIAQKVINVSGKIQKKQVQVSPRKNEIIKSVKKPLALTYENYVETNTSSITTIKKGAEKIPIPSTSKKIEIKTNLKSGRGNSIEQKVETQTKSSRLRTEGNGNKTTTTTTTTTETKTRIGRNKSEANLNKGGSTESKVTVTKTKITNGGKGKKYEQLEISSNNGKNINESSGSSRRLKAESSSRGGKKVETTTTKQVITESSERKRGGDGGSGAKITTIKKTEVSYGTDGKESGNKRSQSSSRVKQETSSTTTTTKTVVKTSKVESEIGGGEGGKSVVKKFKSIRRMKK